RSSTLLTPSATPSWRGWLLSVGRRKTTLLRVPWTPSSAQPTTTPRSPSTSPSGTGLQLL
ncbi:unnamed protein product, partial [Ectocarpus sp. 12 AP-2014]